MNNKIIKSIILSVLLIISIYSDKHTQSDLSFIALIIGLSFFRDFYNNNFKYLRRVYKPFGFTEENTTIMIGIFIILPIFFPAMGIPPMTWVYVFAVLNIFICICRINLRTRWQKKIKDKGCI